MVQRVATLPCSSENTEDHKLTVYGTTRCNATMFKRELDTRDSISVWVFRVATLPCSSENTEDHKLTVYDTTGCVLLFRRVATLPCSSENTEDHKLTVYGTTSCNATGASRRDPQSSSVTVSPPQLHPAPRCRGAGVPDSIPSRLAVCRAYRDWCALS